jgi:hypothetical protein
MKLDAQAKPEDEKKSAAAPLPKLEEEKARREAAPQGEKRGKGLDRTAAEKSEEQKRAREAAESEAKEAKSRDLSAAARAARGPRRESAPEERAEKSVEVQAQGSETQSQADLAHGQLNAVQEDASKNMLFRNKTRILGKNTDSVFAQCVVKALEQTVISGNEGAEPLPLRGSTHVDCIPVNSARFKGLLIYGTSATEHSGADFSRTMKNFLLSLMNERGEDM